MLKIQKFTVDNIRAMKYYNAVEGERFKDSEGRFYCVEQSHRLLPDGTHLVTWNVHHYAWDCRYQSTDEFRSFVHVKAWLKLKLANLARAAVNLGQIKFHVCRDAEIAEYEKWDGS